VEIVLYVLDNNSRDNSLKKVEGYPDQRNIRIFKNNATLEPYENWKEIYRKAKYETFTHVCYIASDDYWDKNDYLYNMLQTFELKTETKVVYPKFVDFSTAELKPPVIHELNANHPNKVKRRTLLLGDWTYVYLNYGLFTKDYFAEIMEKEFSKFSSYIGSDWWLTYEILRSTQPKYCEHATYYKDSDRNMQIPKLSPLDTVWHYLSFPSRHLLCEIHRFGIKDTLDFFLILLWSISFCIGKILLVTLRSTKRRLNRFLHLGGKLL
jgi:hypothetical protein